MLYNPSMGDSALGVIYYSHTLIVVYINRHLIKAQASPREFTILISVKLIECASINDLLCLILFLCFFKGRI